MFQQAAIPIQKPAVFEPMKAAIEAAFAAPAVENFLRGVQRARLRVREFGPIREKGLLGLVVMSGYLELDDSDRGQIRELYLRAVERVPQEIRGKYLKIYAYY